MNDITEKLRQRLDLLAEKLTPIIIIGSDNTEEVKIISTPIGVQEHSREREPLIVVTPSLNALVIKSRLGYQTNNYPLTMMVLNLFEDMGNQPDTVDNAPLGLSIQEMIDLDTKRLFENTIAINGFNYDHDGDEMCLRKLVDKPIKGYGKKYNKFDQLRQSKEAKGI